MQQSRLVHGPGGQENTMCRQRGLAPPVAQQRFRLCSSPRKSKVTDSKSRSRSACSENSDIEEFCSFESVCVDALHNKQTESLEAFRRLYGLTEESSIEESAKVLIRERIGPVLLEHAYDVDSLSMGVICWDQLVGKEHFFHGHYLQDLLRELSKRKETSTTKLKDELALEKELTAHMQSLNKDLETMSAAHTKLFKDLENEKEKVDILESRYDSLLREEKNVKQECHALSAQLDAQQKHNESLRAKFESSNSPRSQAQNVLEQEQCDQQCSYLRDVLLKAEETCNILNSEYSYKNFESQSIAAQIGAAASKDHYLRKETAQLYQTREEEAVGKDIDRTTLTPRPSWTQFFKITKTETCDDDVTIRRTDELVRILIVWIDRFIRRTDYDLQRSRVLHEINKSRVHLHAVQDQVSLSIQRYRDTFGCAPDSEEKFHQDQSRASLAQNSLTDVSTTLDKKPRKLSLPALANIPSSPKVRKKKDKALYITALGTHAEVPRYLRHQGKIRLLHLKKAEVDRVIQQVYAEKRKREHRHHGQKFSLEDMLYERLYKKLGPQPEIAEYGYNFLLALDLYRWDFDIDMFFVCLTGALSESVYLDQENMLQHCRRLMTMLSETNAQNVLMDGLFVSLKEALLLLQEFFPLKSAIQMQDIKQAILKDMGELQQSDDHALLGIDDILAESEMCLHQQTFFTRTLREQHFREVQLYYTSILDELSKRDTNDTGYLNLRSVVEVICYVDQGLTAPSVTKKIMQVLEIKDKNELVVTERIDYKALLRKMNRSILMKYSKNYETTISIDLLVSYTRNARISVTDP